MKNTTDKTHTLWHNHNHSVLNLHSRSHCTLFETYCYLVFIICSSCYFTFCIFCTLPILPHLQFPSINKLLSDLTLLFKRFFSNKSSWYALFIYIVTWMSCKQISYASRDIWIRGSKSFFRLPMGSLMSMSCWIRSDAVMVCSSTLHVREERKNYCKCVFAACERVCK